MCGKGRLAVLTTTEKMVMSVKSTGKESLGQKGGGKKKGV